MMYSASNCTESDDNVTRAPNDDEEGNKFFVDGVYNGFFRKADSNDCDKNPTTCTGHVIIPPCKWSTFTETQFFWNDVALSGSGSAFANKGYSYSQVVEIFQAGIKTKNDVIILLEGSRK